MFGLAQRFNVGEQGRPEVPLLELADRPAASKLGGILLGLKFGYSFDHSNHNPTNKARNRCNDWRGQGLDSQGQGARKSNNYRARCCQFKNPNAPEAARSYRITNGNWVR